MEYFEVRIGLDLARLPVIVKITVSDMIHNLGFRIQQPCAIASLIILASLYSKTKIALPWQNYGMFMLSIMLYEHIEHASELQILYTLD